MLNDIIFEFKVLSNIIVDANKESNNIITNIAADLYNTTAYKLRNTNNILDILSKLIAVDILGITKLDLITSEYNIINLDILGVKSRA
jgi:S-adenosylmethionine/arginine decarboxylase-like enzyme